MSNASDQEKSSISPEDREIIREETEFFGQVCESIRRTGIDRSKFSNRSQKDLISLRDATLNARPGDLPTMLNELHQARSLEAREKLSPLPDLESPYFAHLRIREGKRVRDLFLGKGTFISSYDKIRIIDWRNAPLSKIFYHYREGDEYVEQLPGRMAEGVVEVRRVLTFSSGELVRIVTSDKTLSRNGDGNWLSMSRSEMPVLEGGEGTAERGRKLGTGKGGLKVPDVTALLDPIQFDLLAKSGSSPILVLGGAGSGKTTVALHRLATLAFNDPEKYAPRRMGVLVPEKGLAKWIVKLLETLQMEEVPVDTFSGWFRRHAEHLIRAIPSKIYNDTPLSVARIKRHPALWAALPEWVDQQTIQIKQKIVDLFPDDLSHVQKPVKNAANQLAAVEAAMRFANKHLAKRDHKQLRQIERKLSSMRKRIFRTMEDLWELMSDRDVLASVVAESDGALSESSINTAVRHTLSQMDESADSKYAGMDEARLQTLDGKSLDDSTPDDLSGTRDVEDDALLLEMLRLKTGGLQNGRNRIPHYNHLVLDEAQELSAVELSVIGQTLGQTPSVTIAGDAAQQIREVTSFSSWDELMKKLGAGEASRFTLKVNYRSSVPVARYAHEILGPLAPENPPEAQREGVEVGRFAFPSEEPASIFLAEAIGDLVEREPFASTAIICRNMESARSLYALLEELPRVRLVSGGNFPFSPGVDVTDVSQIKGLEFDYVIIPDANAGLYPMMPESRRLLHVAATRAIHQLWVVSVGHSSPVLPG